MGRKKTAASRLQELAQSNLDDSLRLRQQAESASDLEKPSLLKEARLKAMTAQKFSQNAVRMLGKRL